MSYKTLIFANRKNRCLSGRGEVITRGKNVFRRLSADRSRVQHGLPCLSIASELLLCTLGPHLESGGQMPPGVRPRGLRLEVHAKPLVPAVSETPRLGIMFVVYQSDAKVVKCVFSMLKSGDKIKLNIVFVFTRVQKPMVLMPWLSG